VIESPERRAGRTLKIEISDFREDTDESIVVSIESIRIDSHFQSLSAQRTASAAEDVQTPDQLLWSWQDRVGSMLSRMKLQQVIIKEKLMQVRRIVSVGRAAMAIASVMLPVAIIQAASGNSSNIHIKNFGRVDDGYYRGAQPGGHDYRDLASMGVKTVIDLEMSGDRDEAGMVKGAGMKFYRIPMSDHSRPDDRAVKQFLGLVNDPANQPVFVHCHGGRHRTGAMTAVYRMTHNGWNANQAYSEMKQYEFDSGIGHGTLKDYVYSYYSQLVHDKLASDGKPGKGENQGR
jgi:protein tyrosine phosphatase (PTP) superfamily phosphohydrolase (DUF442 family)